MYVIKKWSTFILALGTLLVTSALYSCSDDDEYSLDKYSFGVATVKPLGSSAYYLQWDDHTTFWPAAGISPSFSVDQERRVFINFTLLGDSTNGLIEGYDYAIRVNRIDSILTKSIAANLGRENDTYYGNDPLWIKSAWIEDNYINFQFESYFDGNTRHFLNLVQMDEASPYELEFRHNAYNNLSGAQGWGLAAFRLHSLPETNGETVTMKIKYKSYEGDETIELKYKSGSPTGSAPVMRTEHFQMIH